MIAKKEILPLSILLLSPLSHAGNVDFFPEPGNKYTIMTEGNSISIVNNDKEIETITFETEMEQNIEIADYNFDGNLDFSTWHMDEGMGTYSIYRIFIFNSKDRKFTEASPKCGDEFINAKLDEKNKSISSTYFKNNTPIICHTKL